MKVHISARIDEELVSFLEAYQLRHSIKTRSETLERAIEALRDVSLEAQYESAMAEWLGQDESLVAAWHSAAGDGLDSDEDW